MKLAIVDDNKLEQELIFDTLRTYEHERNISLDISSYSDGNSFFRRQTVSRIRSSPLMS